MAISPEMTHCLFFSIVLLGMTSYVMVEKGRERLFLPIFLIGLLEGFHVMVMWFEVINAAVLVGINLLYAPALVWAFINMRGENEKY